MSIQALELSIIKYAEDRVEVSRLLPLPSNSSSSPPDSAISLAMPNNVAGVDWERTKRVRIISHLSGQV